MKTKNLSIFLTVLLIACSDVDDNPKPDRTQFEILLEKAQQNDAEAQYNLGTMYYYGGGVPQNFATAKAWYEKAAAQGDIRSQNNLGFMYTQGQGGHKDFNTAKFWYEKAAAQEDTDAQYNLGLIYLNGRGIGKDLNTAKKWFKQSCDNGNQQGCDEYRILNPH